MIYCILDSEDKKTMTYLTEDMLSMLEELYPLGGYKVIEISTGLHNYLVGLGQCKLIADVEDREYTILDKDLFERAEQPVDTTPQQPSMEERLAALETLMMGVI